MNTTIPWTSTYLYVHLDDITPVIKLQRTKKLSNGSNCFIQQFEEIEDAKPIVYRKESVTAHTTKHPLAIYTQGKLVKRRNTKLLVKYQNLHHNALISRWTNVHDHDVCSVLQIIETVKSVPFLHLINYVLSTQLTQQSLLLSQQQQQQQQQQPQKSSRTKPRYSYSYSNTYDDDEQKEEPNNEDLLPPQLPPQEMPSPNDDDDDDDDTLPPFPILINKYSDNNQNNSGDHFEENHDEDLLPPDLKGKDHMDISDNERTEGEEFEQQLSQKRTVEGMSDDDDDDDGDEEEENDNIPQKINSRFFQKSFARKQRQQRKLQKASKLFKQSKDKASQKADKDKHRHQIEFTTKYKFCRELERTGQPVAQVWRRLRREGWDVGKGYSNVYRWKHNGSRYYFKKLSEAGNGFRLKYIHISVNPHLHFDYIYIYI